MKKAGLTGDTDIIMEALRDIKNVNKKKYQKKGWARKLVAAFSSRKLT